MFQHLYDEWLTKLSEKAAHLSGLFPNIVVQEGAVEKPLRDYSVSEQAAIASNADDQTEQAQANNEEHFVEKGRIGHGGTDQRALYRPKTAPVCKTDRK